VDHIVGVVSKSQKGAFESYEEAPDFETTAKAA
jgi:hypothetical protein